MVKTGQKSFKNISKNPNFYQDFLAEIAFFLKFFIFSFVAFMEFINFIEKFQK